MKRKTSPHQAALTDRTTIKVRFSEIDSMQIVWHGEYVRYFEDGREAFGKRYGLDYMSIYREGYVVPIVDLVANPALSTEVKYPPRTTLSPAIRKDRIKIRNTLTEYLINDASLSFKNSLTMPPAPI